jgi:DUF438 domain-containing protein
MLFEAGLMILNATTKLDSLLKAYPFLLEFLAGLSPKFRKLKNPVLRRTMGKVATLEQVAGLGEIPVQQLMEAIAAEVRQVAHESVEVEDGNSSGSSTAFADRESRKEILKDIIRDLHRGGDVENLKKRFAVLVRDVSGSEIGAMEQELIAEGLPEDEVKKLCDVHVRVFKESLEKEPTPSTVPGHPLHTLAEENRALEKLVAETRSVLSQVPSAGQASDWGGQRPKLLTLLGSLSQVEKHYQKKEYQLFPLLEARGASGPSKVMWAIHDDIRAHLKIFRETLGGQDRELAVKSGELVLGELSDMIYKEEKILFPMSLEMLDDRDWMRVKTGEEEIGYAWITPGRQWKPAITSEREGESKTPTKPETTGPSVELETGTLTPELVNWIFKSLPVDVSFVDEEDTVRYYSAKKDRIFVRTPAVIGRKVQNCHPSKSLDAVNRVLEAFRAGRRDAAEFWIETGGKFVHISYYAVRDADGRYRGCLEVSQDVTHIRTLRGQKRLLDWE